MLCVCYSRKVTGVLGRAKRTWISSHTLVPSFKDRLKYHLF